MSFYLLGESKVEENGNSWASVVKPVTVPVSLQVIAGLLIIGGGWALLGMLVRLMFGNIYLDLSALGLWAGLGLLNLRNGWRRFVLVMSILFLISFFVLICINWGEEGPAAYDIMGLQQGYVLKWAFWSVLVSYALFTLWVFWELLRPSVRELFVSQDPLASNAFVYPKPFWTTFWIIFLLAVYIGLNINCIAMAQSNKYKPTPIWANHRRPFLKSEGEKWNGTFEWCRPGLESSDINQTQGGKIIVVASQDGKELARFVCDFELKYVREGFPKRSWNGDYPAVVRFVDRSPQVDPEYAIRATVYWWQGYDNVSLDMKFALVSIENDDSESFIYFPTKNSSPESSSNSYNDCPELNMLMHVSQGYIKSLGIMREVFATGVTNLSAPRGMFPGVTQPIDWSLRFHSLEDPDENRWYRIPVGETSDPQKKR